MPHRRFAIGAIVLSCLAAAPAFADPQVSAATIVDFFTKPDNLGAARGICIGPKEKCEPAKPKSLNMMINFELDSTRFTPQGKQNLDEFAKALADKRLSNAHFVVEGYTDALGTEAHNKVLSEERAKAVTEFLVANGISADKVTAIGMGEKDPIDPNPVSPVNRRVEMRAQVQ